MSAESIATIAAAVVSIVGAAVVVIKAILSAPGEKADLAGKLQKMVNDAVENAEAARKSAREANARYDLLEIKVDQQEKDLGKLRRVLDEYKRGVRILVSQLRSHGLPPAWTPENFESEEGEQK